ncbi:hypothetical protein ACMS09_000825 [Cronobacter malonaticus]
MTALSYGLTRAVVMFCATIFFYRSLSLIDEIHRQAAWRVKEWHVAVFTVLFGAVIVKRNARDSALSGAGSRNNAGKGAGYRCLATEVTCRK